MKTTRNLSEEDQSLLRRTVKEKGPAVASDIFQIRLPKLVEIVTGLKISFFRDGVEMRDARRAWEKYYAAGLVYEKTENPSYTYRHKIEAFMKYKEKTISQLVLDLKASEQTLNEKIKVAESPIEIELPRNVSHLREVQRKRKEIIEKRVEAFKEVDKFKSKKEALEERVESWKNFYYASAPLILGQYRENGETFELFYEGFISSNYTIYRYNSQGERMSQKELPAFPENKVASWAFGGICLATLGGALFAWNFLQDHQKRAVEERFLEKAQEQWAVQKSNA